MAKETLSWNGLKKNCQFLTHSQKKTLIEKHDPNINIKRRAELLGISRSSIYYQPRISQENIRTMNLIDEIYTDCPFYGSRRIRRDLEIYHQTKVCRQKIQRMMRLMGLDAIYPKKRTSFSDQQHKIYPYLLRGLTIGHPNHVWSTDITYVRLEHGWAYLIAIMDWYSRYVIAWQLSANIEIDFCLETLKEALNKNIPEIFNSDQDTRFTSPQFTDILENKGVKISMDGRGRYLDNIFNERLWRTVKYENIYIRHYQNIVEAKKGLTDYFNFYNNRRLHDSLDDRTPAQVYLGSQISVSQPIVMPYQLHLSNSN